MGSSLRQLASIALPIVGSIIGGPAGAAIGGGAGGLLNGGGVKGALLGAGTAGIGSELSPVLGDAFAGEFPETAADLGIGGGANSLTDLLGLTTGGSSWTGPGTLAGAGDSLSSILSGSSPSSALGANTDGLNLSGAGNGAANSGFSNNPLGLDSTSFNPSPVPNLSTLSPVSSSLAGAPNLSTGGGSSIFGKSSLGPLSTLLGGGYDLYATNKAKNDLASAGAAAQQQLQPFVNNGTAANTQLSNLLGTSGNTGAAGYGSLTTPFTGADLTSNPAYQFQLQQGQQALDRQNAASGSYFSGGALKGAQDYAQGLAGTAYNNAFNQDLQTKQNTYGDLSGLSGTGLSAAGASGNIGTGIGTAQAAAGIQGANILGQSLSSLLNGSGAKKPVNIGGQVYYV